MNSTVNYAQVITTDSSLPFSQLREWALRILAPAAPAILLFGLISNIINIIVFFKAGLKDNVTILLFFLAISDLTFIILITPTPCTLIVLRFARSWSWPFQPDFTYFLLYWPAFTAYDLSAFISVSLGVMRCACVAMPLKFKFVFTRRRTILTVFVLFVLAVSLRIPMLSIFRVAWRTDAATNVTTAYLAAVNRVAMSRINDVMNRGLVVWINYTIMVSCVALLSFKLSEASKIRRSCTFNNDSTSEKTAVHGLSPKDLQVVKSVVIVCVIFIFSQLPFLLYSTARLINPELTSTSRMRKLFSFLSHVSLTCSYLNASLNIFVYYNYNSKYRSVLISLLPSRKNH
ncbi:chemosensory receptor A [Elysia marginata]|uniref:Chemosensory receptor A n=1 Tax=Elysia marginata TaxID=1093978 RepID=A0AAV4HGU7_9GAST|nr:chemosensory receptor A [Elysia marginata]